ncbi:sugar kinase [Falsiroseomonas selenitidurans]|uniref:Sugar kinase n=1 Tax=Falsiroseomonas selenitidurans TaxID=2716335 RepID=A0ABX1E3D1_9PROT|nr:sugar kinase [Falsiroseomonas selenitidurans]NKC31533.1 sugar kinase [Falsiroseomonas selenitidurans]
MPDILCLGEPMLEFNQQPTGPDGRSLYLEGHGGDTSNAAIAAARSGADAGMIAQMGDDRPGRSFAELWAMEGVDTATVRTDPEAPTGIYFVTHSEKGHDFTFYRKGSAASRMRVQDVPEAAIRQARILHLSGISLGISDSACDAAFHAIQVARQAGVTVSFDTNLRLRLWPLRRASACIHTAVGMADMAFPSLDDAKLLTGLAEPEAIADFYLKLCPLVLLKLGEEGLLVATREARARIPGFKVEAVDATGAGDTLAGAFMARAVAGDDTWKAARYANAAAALSTTGYGAVAPIPSAAAVHAFLEAQGEAQGEGHGA